jgi:two-component system cell cycle sensor histidine kinase/response regulator CckA
VPSVKGDGPGGISNVKLVMRGPGGPDPELLQKQLEALGYRVGRARDARQARALGEPLDVVLLEDEASEPLAREALCEAARALDAGFWEWRPATNQAYLSPEWKRLLGYAAHELGDAFAVFEERLHPEDREPLLAQLREYLAGAASSGRLEFRLRHRDGSYRSMLALVSGAPRPEPHLCGLNIDITERRLDEQRLRISEERLRLAVSGANLGIWHWNLKTNEVVASERTRELFGIGPDVSINYPDFLQLAHPDDRPFIDSAVKRALRERSDYDVEFRNIWPDGSVHWTASKGRAQYDEQGKPVRMEGIALDVTPRKLAEAAMQASEARLRHLTDVVPDMIWQFTPQLEFTYANQRYRDYFGRDSINPAEWWQVIHPDDLPHAERVAGDILQQPEGEIVQRLRRKDGVYRWFRSRFVLVRDADGNPLYIVGASTDIDVLKRTEEALREARSRLMAALEAGGIGTWLWDEGGDVIWDPSLTRLLGREREEPERVSFEEALQVAHPDHRAQLEQVLRDGLASGHAIATEFQAVRADGRVLWVALRGRVERDAHGRPSSMVGATVDVTRSKQLEEQLRQAQKMEAIGQLAGGIAHDFNNILTVILGQASLALTYPDTPPRVANALREINDAAERASGLTAQLLAFGRRQMMQEQTLDLNTLVAGVMSMLRRVVGEDVDCAFEPCPEPVPVRADPNMLTQVLLNLAVNARGAMPGGGRLVIRTGTVAQDVSGPASVEPSGPCASLWVSDTGVGIRPEVLPHIFEPFFTTKEAGGGTGLGLSTVYGIVQQHRGHIRVETEVDRGTTFQITLPLVEGAQASPESAQPSRGRIKGDGETILLVEDEQAVRALQQRALEDHGYRVIAVPTGTAALEAWRQHGPRISLLLTDVVLPGGTSGLQLAQQLRVDAPELRTILSSGYSDEVFGKSFVPDPRVTFLQKPYSVGQLLEAVKRALSEASGEPKA